MPDNFEGIVLTGSEIVSFSWEPGSRISLDLFVYAEDKSSVNLVELAFFGVRAHAVKISGTPWFSEIRNASITDRDREENQAAHEVTSTLRLKDETSLKITSASIACKIKKTIPRLTPRAD